MSDIEPCSFCATITNGMRVKSRYDLVAVVPDANPVTEGHLLVLPVRHVPDFFEMTDLEARDAYTALHELRDRLLADDPQIEGFNVGTNCGEVAGQTIFHAHIHLIPRRTGDTPNPRGGVRGVVPTKMSY
jgi:diadenosine tetraphosphate (Ap4A) HIT family hydrolase